MHKRVLAPDAEPVTEWLDLSDAEIEVSSENAAHPIEHALSLTADSPMGWCASEVGRQTIRIRFDQPRGVSRIHLAFEEFGQSRSQEFSLSWSSDECAPCRELLRQQWNFSPDGSCCETEDFRVELQDVKVLQLTIDPDRGAGRVTASLKRLRIA